MKRLTQEENDPHAEASFCTPFPWTVTSHADTEGGYVIREASHEQQAWCDQGYDLSLEEGDRRGSVAAQHEAGNIRLLEAAPALFLALRHLAISTGDAAAARSALVTIFPDWQQMEIHDREGGHP